MSSDNISKVIEKANEFIRPNYPGAYSCSTDKLKASIIYCGNSYGLLKFFIDDLSYTFDEKDGGLLDWVWSCTKISDDYTTNFKGHVYVVSFTSGGVQLVKEYPLGTMSRHNNICSLKMCRKGIILISSFTGEEICSLPPNYNFTAVKNGVTLWYDENLEGEGVGILIDGNSCKKLGEVRFVKRGYRTFIYPDKLTMADGTETTLENLIDSN